MEISKHVSNEMEELADSLIKELESICPSSQGCSIYRVPESRRSLHPTHYTPQMVSIGPLHHGKEELKAMEEYKRRYLKYFLQRTTVSAAHFFAFIKEREAKLRNCYLETIHLKSDDFVKMVLVDAVFLIEFFLRCYIPDLRTNDDFWRIMRLEIQYDFLLLENQLPFFILNDLFNLVKTTTYGEIDQEISIFAIACSSFRVDIMEALPIREKLSEIDFSKARHFLDMFILCFWPSQSSAQLKFKCQYQEIPCAKDLHQAGVKFISGLSKNPLDIRFNNGILEIPKFGVYSRTELLLRNLLVYESLQYDTFYLNDYIKTMGFLIRNSKDAELLIQNKIVEEVDNELLPTAMVSLRRECIINYRCYKYSDIVARLHDHCKLQRNKWKASLKQNYFNSPWASISIIAAVILLLLTITQTVCSLIAL